MFNSELFVITRGVFQWIQGTGNDKKHNKNYQNSDDFLGDGGFMAHFLTHISSFHMCSRTKHPERRDLKVFISKINGLDRNNKKIEVFPLNMTMPGRFVFQFWDKMCQNKLIQCVYII